jgi:hypothetical protein
MGAASADSFYCVDASAFIDLRWRYPKDVFPGVWNRISDLAKERRLISPQEVRRELHGKADEVLQWAKMRPSVFQRLDSNQQKIVREILQRFPNLVDPSKLVRDADPFVVALAIVRKRQEQQSLLPPREWIVVTQEKSTTSGRPKIPNVCAAYNVLYIDILEMFRQEKWKF